ILNKKGQTIDLHLKGAGPTPYSRMGDGRAVLRSVIREYLAGHALNTLGVASSHAVGFTSSTQGVQREKLEPGAMLLRTSECHIRLGHFEWINQYAPELLAEFTQKCIEWHYPECQQEEQPILAFAKAVIRNTAIMIAKWQLVGFAHGVMNTDNLNITGSTLDFGPYGFMERFRPNWINNHSDYQGRYTYQNQPSIAHWNLWTWLNNLIPLAEPEHKEQFKEALAACLEEFEPTFIEHYTTGLCQKMGLPHFHKDSTECGLSFLRILQAEQLDYTQSFIRLQNKEYKALRDDCLDIRQFDAFLTQYQNIREYQDIDELDANMQQVNPIYILRNHMAQRAIEAAERDDFSEVDRLFKLLNHPYTRQPDLEKPEDLGPLPSDVPDVAVSCSS
ncbi:protein adenylyltransferase SelO family protein, partial [Acinetobacter baumannii]